MGQGKRRGVEREAGIGGGNSQRRGLVRWLLDVRKRGSKQWWRILG